MQRRGTEVRRHGVGQGGSGRGEKGTGGLTFMCGE